jgi:iron-sulfur cluster assembly protein
MLELTDSAVKQLKKLVSYTDAKGPFIRIFVYGCGCCGQPSYSIDTTENGKDGDKLLEKDGLKIFIEPAASDGLDNATIDYTEDDLHSGFMIHGLPQSLRC